MFIKATVHTVASVGLENTRTKDIASRSGFTEATMYRLFPTKELLLQETFLHIDRRISNLVMQNSYILHPDKTPRELLIYAMWLKVYRYLLEHPEETLFLIRYRYSSLYTEEVRRKRDLNNGSFDRVYAAMERDLGKATMMSWPQRINSVFETTLCFAERIITGELADTDETEFGMWSLIINMLFDEKHSPNTAN